MAVIILCSLFFHCNPYSVGSVGSVVDADADDAGSDADDDADDDNSTGDSTGDDSAGADDADADDSLIPLDLSHFIHYIFSMPLGAANLISRPSFIIILNR